MDFSHLRSRASRTCHRPVNRGLRPEGPFSEPAPASVLARGYGEKPAAGLSSGSSARGRAGPGSPLSHTIAPAAVTFLAFCGERGSTLQKVRRAPGISRFLGGM